MAAISYDEQKLAKLNAKNFLFLCFLLIFLMLFSTPAVSFSIVKTLPGFSGSLPFKLETGYISVDENEDVQLFYSGAEPGIFVWGGQVVYIGVDENEDVQLFYFYYFIKSEGNPREDPLVLWITGGPGCSALSGIAFEIGPIRFKMDECNGSLPTFLLNPYSWTKVANVIFVDSPVGTGFSYSRTLQGSDQTGDTKFSDSLYEFLRKWLLSHTRFVANPLYIAGDSYSGMVVPIIVQKISEGIEARDKPPLNLEGYLLGNPATDKIFDVNSRVPFAHCMAIIPDELYEVICAKRSCNGEYVDVDSSNIQCANDLQAISNCTEGIQQTLVTTPKCPSSFRRLLIRRPGDPDPSRCNANNATVQKALHVRKGTIRWWIRCNTDLPYKRDVKSTVSYHFYLNRKGYRALIYSGDHDMIIPYIGTQLWIKSLNLSIVDDWRQWLVDDQVGGFTRGFSNHPTYVTVKGGGHTAPDEMPKECYNMFKRWISHEPL